MAADRDPEDREDDAVFVLGRRTDDLPPAERDRRRSSKRFALIALAVVVVIVAVSITLVSLLVDTSPGRPSSPSGAAGRWVQDVVRGDRVDRRRLECADPRSTHELLRVLVGPTGARVGAAVREGARRWRVPVTFDEAGEPDAVRDAVTVVLRDGRYLVC